MTLKLLLFLTFLKFTSSELSEEDAPLRIVQHVGNYSKLMQFTVDNTIEHVLVFPPIAKINPSHVKVWSVDASVRYPLIVVVRQEKEVLSWQIPFLVETSKREQDVQFRNTSRTLCPTHMPQMVKTKHYDRYSLEVMQQFIMALSTSSSTTIHISVIVEEEQDFYLENDRNYSTTVSPSETKYFYYQFPSNKTDTVVIDVSSSDDVCLTVSFQDSKCPVFDLNKDVTYKGKYQTINRKGGMSIRRKDFPDGFFLVFVAKGDNYECSQEHSIIPTARASFVVFDNRTSVIEFKVRNGINGKGYGVASLITFGAILGFYLFAGMLVFIFTRWGTLSKMKNKKEIATNMNGDLRDSNSQNGDTRLSNSQNGDAALLNEIIRPFTREEKLEYLNAGYLNLATLSRTPDQDQRRSFNYCWHILSIAIFYSIPVVQLVITYQRVVNRTGDQNMCYYNFLCANPAWGLSDFNHVFSNIGYGLLGLLFWCVVICRRSTTCVKNDRGIPHHFGIFYAMGFALIMEGVLSGCYHICPSQSNYQFDTSFMYVMAVLCIVKLYQNRHPDINATAYATFTVLGIAIFLAMVGILKGNLTVWCLFVVLYFTLCIYISCKVYFLSFVLTGFRTFWAQISSNGLKIDTIKPIKIKRFLMLIGANVINLSVLIVGLCVYDSGLFDFGTFLLLLLMGNAVIYAGFYTIMKLLQREKLCLEAIVYLILAIISWSFASQNFFDNATLWTVTPAESRQRNQECILMDFYDKHDVWHLLSAPALYFSFMYLVHLDDDLFNTERNKIIVF